MWLRSLCHMLHKSAHACFNTCATFLWSSTIPRLFHLLFSFHVPVVLASSLTFTKSDVVSTSSSLTLAVTTSVWLWCQGTGRAGVVCWWRGEMKPWGHAAWSKGGFRMLFSALGQGELGCFSPVCRSVCMCVREVGRARRLYSVMSCATEVRYSLERSQLVEFRGVLVYSALNSCNPGVCVCVRGERGGGSRRMSEWVKKHAPVNFTSASGMESDAPTHEHTLSAVIMGKVCVCGFMCVTLLLITSFTFCLKHLLPSVNPPNEHIYPRVTVFTIS